MARPQKPWHRKQTGWWMVEIDGVQEKLIQGPKDEQHRRLAEEKLADLRKLQRVAPQSAGARVADVIEAYLAWSRQHLSEETHRVNRYYCQLFAEHCGTVLVRDMKPFHVTAWITAMMSPQRVAKEKALRKQQIEQGLLEKSKQGRQPKEWGPSTAHNARTSAFRVFSWAKEEGIITENPLAAMKRPKPPPRQRAMTDEEFSKMHGHAGGPFRDFLLALRETGARPKEARDLRWNQVKDDGRWVLTKHKTAKKVGKARIVFLSETMVAMMARLRPENCDPNAYVFLNTEGEPWTSNAVRLQVGRLRESLGLAKDLCAYLARHGFGTRAILNGENPIVVAELMGHTSLDMVSRVYVHLADQHEHLRGAVNRINPVSTPAPSDPGPTRKRAKPVGGKKPGRKKQAPAPPPCEIQ